MNNKNSSWKDGPIALTGNWEPLVFRRRRGGGSTDMAEQYRQEHTPDLVRRLKEAGINLLITHYFKGFGLQAEAEDLKYARKLIDLCHQQGIKVGGYIGDTFIHETFLAEEPEAVSWHQIGPDGTAIHMGGVQTFRFRWCRTNPAYLAYLKKVLTHALADGLDLVHFDNFVEKPEPLSCHCRWCVEEFRKFLCASLTKQERLERFGFSDLIRVVPPVFSAPLYIQWQADLIINPLLQEWINFRCHITADRYRQLADFCRKLNPAVAIECNPTGIWGENTAYMRGINHAALLPSGEFFWDESPNPYGLLKNGALCTHLRTMKMAEPLGNRVFYYSRGSELALAEGLAFNRGCLGMVGDMAEDAYCPQFRLYLGTGEGKAKDTLTANTDSCRNYIRLLLEFPDLFCRTKSMAKVAVYRNYNSFAWNSIDPHLQAILAEQTFLENHIPFDIITSLTNLAYSMIVLPGTECVNMEEVEILKKFIARGGSVILTGTAGKYDGWRRERPQDPFAGIRERLIQLPALELPASAPPLGERAVWDEYYRVIDGRYWLRPQNAGLLMKALKKNGQEHVPYDVRAPRTTIVEPRRTEEGAFLIHIIHCNPKSCGRKLIFSLAASSGVRRISLLVPGQKDKKIPFKTRGKTCVFSLAMGAIYGLIILEQTTAS